MEPNDKTLNADLLRGGAQIARFVGQDIRRVFRLLEIGALPAGKEGNTWVASRSVLRQHYARLTGGADAA